MSDPKTVDWDSDEPIVESLMNRIAELEAELAEWERLGVKVWEDCPNQCDQGVVITDVCGCGRINHAEHFEERECADCGGSGKVPVEGVQQAANGWWIAPYRMERR